MADVKTKKLDQKQKKKKIKRIILITILIVFFVGIVSAGAAVYWAYNVVQPVTGLDVANPPNLDLTSYVYDINGNEVARLHEEQNRIYVPINQIPRDLQEAFIAIEDERFEEHYGFDLMGIIRAFWANLRNKTISQGASTITQQYIKLSFLTPRQTYERKVQEIYLAVKLEQELSKEEILERYLNRIYFGSGSYGVEAAAQTFFGKSVGDLEISEMALLAGLVRNPAPYIDVDRAIARRDLVINKMEELEFITPQQAEEARTYEIQFIDPPDRLFPYPYFIDYVVHHELLDILTSLPQYETAQDAYEAIYKGGLHIYTTMEPNLQEEIVAVAENPDHYPETALDENGKPQPQSAIVIADPTTGYIRAMSGGRGYSKTNQDLRYLSRRPPGSSIKPLVTYAPAIEEGIITPGTSIDDAPVAFGRYTPENYERTFWGLMTARHALAHSRNVPAVKIFHQLGTKTGVEYATRMGITTFTDVDYEILGTTLGGVTYGLRPLEMAQAYSVFANMGVKIDLTSVTKIEDSEGQLVYEYKPEPEQIFSEQTAFLINDILKDVLTYGTGSAINPGRTMAAKTGTTDDHRDLWVAAYAPNVVMITWQGYDIPEDGKIRSYTYRTRLANAALAAALKDLPVVNFPSAAGITSASICKVSGLRPGENCPEEDIYREYFPSGKAPTEECTMHVKVEVCAESNLLPTEFCPEETVVEKILLKPREYITTDYRWSGGAGRVPRDVKLFAPDPEFLQEGQTEEDLYCNIHVAGPPAPQGLQAETATNPPRVTLIWQAVQVQEQNDSEGNPLGLAVAGYNVYRSVADEEPQLITASPVTGTTYVDSNVEAGETYTYYVRTVNKKGVKSLAAQLEVSVVPQPLPAPQNLQGAYSGEAAVNLSWSPVQNAVSYHIFRQNGDGTYVEIGNVPAQTAAFTDNSITFTPGESYHYQVKTKGPHGQLSAPAAITIEIPPENPAKPPAPTDLTAALVEGNNIKLDWKAGEQAIQLTGKYRIYRAVDGGEYQSLAAVDVIPLKQNYSFTDNESLLPGTYTYQVILEVNSKKSDPATSNSVEILPPATTSLFKLWDRAAATFAGFRQFLILF